VERWWAAGTLTVLLVACAVEPPPIPLPTSGRPMEAAGDATSGRIDMQGRCVLLIDDGGAMSNLLWPPGFLATGPPVAISDPSGKTIIRANDEVLLGVEDLGLRVVPGCPARHTWAIGEIAQVNGTAVGTPAPQPTRPPKPPR
jgi:hypothetical protein